jgi:hypothetical protein
MIPSLNERFYRWLEPFLFAGYSVTQKAFQHLFDILEKFEDSPQDIEDFKDFFHAVFSFQHENQADHILRCYFILASFFIDPFTTFLALYPHNRNKLKDALLEWKQNRRFFSYEPFYEQIEMALSFIQQCDEDDNEGRSYTFACDSSACG